MNEKFIASNRLLLLFFFEIVAVFWSCSTNNTMKISLENALDSAKNNKVNLQKVLEHYSKRKEDSLKYKAALFLIENMQPYYYDDTYASLHPLMDSLNRSELKTDSVYAIFDSIAQTTILPQKSNQYDLLSLSSEFLIKNIDQAFQAWEASPWHKEVSFHNFCEYILPYAVSTEKRELWRSYYQENYRYYLNEYLAHNDTISLSGFCYAINDSLIRKDKIALYHKGIRQYPPLFVDHIRSGTCEDYGARMIYILRSLGVPVGIDFSPQWANYYMSHSWNILIDTKKNYPFMGFDENIKNWKIESFFHCPKMFRYTYSIQKNSLGAKILQESIPEIFKTPNIIDVTAEYIPVTDVKINLNRNKSKAQKIAYLCVFDNKNWIPVHWGEVKNYTALFKNMGRGLVYLPAYYVNKEIIPASDPFILDTLGKIQPIITDPKEIGKERFYRKYHTFRIVEYPGRMLNGVFQGSNDSDFRKFDMLYTITQTPEFQFTETKISNPNKYRFVRYVGGKKSFTTVAELEFYTKEKQGFVQLRGKPIGTEGTISFDKKNYFEKAFDGDGLTFFYAAVDSGGWTGLDLGTPQKIDKIRYLPKNDDNNVRKGDTYELVFWNGEKWKSLVTEIANKDYIEYDNCPKGALFLLHNLTRGKEERIFTMKNGKPIWW